MEDTVSVLIWEEAMDMTDWARLLLAGSVDTEVRAGTGPWLLRSRCTSYTRPQRDIQMPPRALS